MSKQKPNPYFSIGIISAFFAIAPLVLAFLIKLNEFTIISIFNFIIMGIMAYACFAQTSWVRKYAYVIAGLSILGFILNLGKGYPDYGALILAVIYFYFARGGGPGRVFNNKEFSKESLRNWAIVIGVLVLIIFGFYFWLKFTKF